MMSSKYETCPRLYSFSPITTNPTVFSIPATQPSCHHIQITITTLKNLDLKEAPITIEKAHKIL